MSSEIESLRSVLATLQARRGRIVASLEKLDSTIGTLQEELAHGMRSLRLRRNR